MIMHGPVVSGQEEKSPRASLRLYYLDWLRVLAILTVLVYHSTRFFNMESWNVKNPTWYLLWLFVFSLILYPLMRWLKGRDQGMLSKVGNLLALPGAVYALALPAIVLAVLFDYNSAVMYHNAGWALIVYLWLTLAGFLIVPHDRLQASIQRLRWLSLPLGLVLVGCSVFPLTLEQGPAFGTWRYALGWGARALGSWCCVLAILGLGRKHLTLSRPFLNYANEGVLPFYILHQTVLPGVGYFVVQWTIPGLLKRVIILLVSFPIIMLLYEFLVRRLNLLRILFGMKPRAKRLAVQPGEAVLAR
jgi:glucan biosynthesis protein C